METSPVFFFLTFRFLEVLTFLEFEFEREEEGRDRRVGFVRFWREAEEELEGFMEEGVEEW